MAQAANKYAFFKKKEFNNPSVINYLNAVECQKLKKRNEINKIFHYV